MISQTVYGTEGLLGNLERLRQYVGPVDSLHSQ